MWNVLKVPLIRQTVGARRYVPDAGMDRVRNGHGYDVCEVRADTYIMAG